MKTINILISIFILISTFFGCSGTNDPTPGGSGNDTTVVTGPGGYLFAHMTNEDYGRLYYSISRDGFTWEELNNGSRINNDYLGHPDICKGKDGRYYMVGVNNLTDQRPILWVSTNLIKWTSERYLPASLFTTQMPDNPTDAYLGAPKLFYDEDSEQYIMTWHASSTGLTGSAWWEGMRTYYVLTSNFIDFTEPTRLFNFKTSLYRNMATIDAIIRKTNGMYYAIIKDERNPNAAAGVQGKAVCIVQSESLTGPYSEPNGMITESWREAPAIVPKIDDDGWLLYVEDYTKHDYHIYECGKLSTLPKDWTLSSQKVSGRRHGAVIRISESGYNSLKRAYGN